jgi:DNA-binding CsgD family transcriptional regulator
MIYLPDIIELDEFVNEAEDLKDIEYFLADICDKSGIAFFLYGIRVYTSRSNPRDIVITNYPEKWREHYVNKDYITQDPTVHHCLESMRPVVWKSIASVSCKAGKNILLEAHDYGLKAGISASTRTPEMISMISFAGPSLSIDKMISGQTLAQILLPFLHDTAKKIVKDKSLMPDIRLTPKQRECLAWVADGKDMDMIANIMRISVHTVNEHLKSIRSRMGVSNTPHAVATAIAMGLI